MTTTEQAKLSHHQPAAVPEDRPARTSAAPEGTELPPSSEPLISSLEAIPENDTGTEEPLPADAPSPVASPTKPEAPGVSGFEQAIPNPNANDTEEERPSVGEDPREAAVPEEDESGSDSGSQKATISAHQYINLKDKQPDEDSTTTMIQNVELKVEKEALHLDLQPIAASDLLHYRDLFVPPAGFTTTKSRFGSADHRVFVVHGPSLSGKYMTAVNIALQACPQIIPQKDASLSNLDLEDESKPPALILYRRQRFETVALQRVLEQVKRRDSVLLVRDAFEKNISLDRLTGAEFEHLQQTLRHLELQLVFTTELTANELSDLDAVKIGTEEVDRRAIYERHLEVRYPNLPEDQRSILRDMWPKVDNHLSAPSHISRFLQALDDLSGNLEEARLIKLARATALFGQISIRSWFGKLSLEARVFALLTGLFEGIDLPTLSELYQTSVHHFRRDGLRELRDPRILGLQDLLREIRAVDENGQVGFVNSLVRREVERQIENHYPLVGSLQQVFVDIVRENPGFEAGRLRKFLGTALGRLSSLRKARLEQTLEVLADDSRRSVAATAGYTLAEVSRHSTESQAWTFELLERWILSGRPERMWAAGAAIWRLHHSQPVHRTERESFLRQLHHRLRLLVQRANKFHSEFLRHPPEVIYQWVSMIIRSAFFCIHRMMEHDPASTCLLLAGWLRTGTNEKIHSIGKQSIATWLIDSRDNSHQIDPLLRRSLLQLTPDVLSTGDAALLREFLVTCKSWLKQGSEDEEPGNREVEQALLNGMNSADIDQLKALRFAMLACWVDGRDPATELTGRRLLRRLQALLGIPSPQIPPRAMLALDSSRRSKEKNLVPRLASQICALLEGYLLIESRHLGRSEAAATATTSSRFGGSTNHPRLLAPLFEAETREPARLLFVLHLGKILDWKDLQLPSSPRRRTGLTVSDREQRLNSHDRYPWTLASVDEPWLLCHWLDQIRFDLASESDHQQSAQQLTIDRSDLQDLLEQLSDAGSLESDKDPFAQLVTQALAGLQQNFQLWVELICTALAEDPECPEKRWALAVSRAYFQSLGRANSALQPEHLDTLGTFVKATCQQGWQGGQAVMVAVHDWLQDRNACRVLLHEGDSTPRLVQWLRPLFPEAQEAFTELFEAWLRQETQDQGTSAFSSALQLLWRRLAQDIGSEALLDQLEHPYTLILVDSGAQDDSHLAHWIKAIITTLDTDGEVSIFYLLGQDRPSLPNFDSFPSAIPSVAKSPRLLGPILEAHDPQRLRGAVLFAKQSPEDLLDWSDSPWRKKLLVVPLKPFDPAPFSLLRPPEKDAYTILQQLFAATETRDA